MNTPTTPPTPDYSDMPQSPDVRNEDTLANEVFADDARTSALPTTGAPTATTGTPATATGTAPAAATTTTTTPEQQWLTGPAPFALVLGLLGLLVAGSILLTELTDVTLPWGDLGPWSVVAAGLVVLLVGAIGLRASRTRS